MALGSHQMESQASEQFFQTGLILQEAPLTLTRNIEKASKRKTTYHWVYSSTESSGIVFPSLENFRRLPLLMRSVNWQSEDHITKQIEK